MMKYAGYFLILLTTLALAGCDETDFVSTWRDPATTDLDLRGETAAFLLSGNTAVRRTFEENLAEELNKNGIETVPGYELLPGTETIRKSVILKRLGNTTADHAVFMRVVDRKQELSYVPGAVWYPGAYYDPFLWYDGRYYGPAGFVGPWPSYYDPGYYRTDTIVSVETLVYSVPDSKLLWAGMSKTMNPSEIDEFVKDLVSETVDELHESGYAG
jgi:hypothetical protein